MNHQPDKRFLLVVLIFGILAAVAGSRWLSSGNITIREAGAHVGSSTPSPPSQSGQGGVAGTIDRDDALYHPLRVAWIALGTSMVMLAALAFFTLRVLLLKLSAYSCLVFLLLGFGTVAAALWSGP